MNKKKILIFIDWYLPGFRAGGPIRSCANLVSHLSEDFDFYIVTTDTDYMSGTPYENLKPDHWNSLPDGSKVWYISRKNLRTGTIRNKIHEVRPDFIYLNGVYSRLFTIAPLKHADKIIVSVRGMLAPSALAIKPVKKRLFFLYAKFTGLFSRLIFQASTPEEKGHIAAMFPGAVIRIAPNLAQKSSASTVSKAVKIPNELRLLHVARIAPEKNLLFAVEILRKLPGNVVMDLYGPVYDAAYWDLCQKVIRELPENIKINYKGAVEPHRLSSLMNSYDFLFLPSRGENFGHVILESMSAGLPVILSDQTPWKGLAGKKAGWDIPLNESALFESVLEKCSRMGQEEYKPYSDGALSAAAAFVNDPQKVEENKRLFS